MRAYFDHSSHATALATLQVPEEFQKGIDEGKKAAIDKAAAGAEPVDVTPPAEAPAKE